MDELLEKLNNKPLLLDVYKVGREYRVMLSEPHTTGVCLRVTNFEELTARIAHYVKYWMEE